MHLATLEKAGDKATVDQVLDVLIARDRVQLALQDRPTVTREVFTELHALDERIRKLAGPITARVDPAKWTGVAQPFPDAWWWSLRPPAAPRWALRHVWLWNAVAVLWLMLTLFLIFDMVPRFPNIGPDTVNTFVRMAQMAAAILAAGGALTLAGRKLVDNILLGMRVPTRRLPEAKIVLALVTLGLLLWLRTSLPAFARFYNNRGVVRHHTGEITLALQDYERAIKLDPNFIEVHYNMGLVQEDLGNVERAKVEYRFAVEANLDLAYINLSRLYIMDGKYSLAASLLEQRLQQVTEDEVQYDLLKNLGWARVGQQRYDEAITQLRQAIELAPDHAPAHCLLAQAYEGSDDEDSALTEWENCLALASVLRPDEDSWIGMAKQRLSAQ